MQRSKKPALRIVGDGLEVARHGEVHRPGCCQIDHELAESPVSNSGCYFRLSGSTHFTEKLDFLSEADKD
jgi:hypothetical protein